MPASRLLAGAAAVALATGGGLLAAAPAAANIVDQPTTVSAPGAQLSLNPIGTFETGVFDKSAAEIVAFHAKTQRIFTVNAEAGEIDVLDASDPTKPVLVDALAGPAGMVANSLAIRADGLGVVALEAADKVGDGRLMFFDANDAQLEQLGSVTVGALPDMVTISKDGRYAVVANEGEPADDFSSDPEGSIGVVTLPASGTVTAPAQSAVRIADFHDFEAGGPKTLPEEVRVFGPTPHGADKPVSRNLEPEYIAIDGDTAYAALQEANAVAVIDLATAEVQEIWPLGVKDHGLPGNGIDASDRDPNGAPAFNIRSYPGLKGMYMPDGLNSYTSGGQTFLVTANEGDAREWGEYNEVSRVKDLGKSGVAPVCADSPLYAQRGDALLGRLNVTTENGLRDGENCYEELYAFGGRSFSIWTTGGEQVFDSGEDFERITHEAAPEFFNSNHSESNLEGRSDDKGPEPENMAIGRIDGRTYAFIGLERVGGVMVYDITTPADTEFVTYLNNRDFSVSVEGSADEAAALKGAGDLGPEGLAFVSAPDSPTGAPMLVVGNEVSGTTTIFDIRTKETTIQLLGINDFHGRLEAADKSAGAAVLAGAVKQLRSENPNSLFVSVGDNIGASTFTSLSQDDNPTIDALKAAGLDASAVGNHEFDQGYADLRDRVIPRYGDTRFALGANVYGRDGEPVLDEYWVKEIDGIRVGVIGTVTEQTKDAVSPAGITGLTFGDQVEAANRVAAQLRDGNPANGEADVVVLLAHEGSASKDCAAIAAEDTDFGDLVRDTSADVDAILSGHTHSTYACAIPVRGSDVPRPVLQAAQYGESLDQLELRVDRATKRLVSTEQRILALAGQGYPADAGVAKIVDTAAAQAEVVGGRTIGTITGDIVRGGTPAGADRGVESRLGNLVADIQLWATSNDDFGGEKAQIALMNPGGLRDDLIAGRGGAVTYKQVALVQPFGNTLVTLDLTGAQLKQVLEEQWQPAGASRPKLHLGVSAGFTYEYVVDAPRGAHVTSMAYRGEPIADGDTFRVVTNSFLAAGGDAFAGFTQGTRVADTGQTDLNATLGYFAAHEPVSPAPLGRAKVADPAAWVKVGLSTDSPVQGETVQVALSGLTPGQQVSAVLRSEPIVIEAIPAASAAGTTAFEIAIPEDFEVGSHSLTISSAGETPVVIDMSVVSARAAAVPGDGSGGGSGGGSGAGGGDSAAAAGDGLAATGADAALPLAAGALLLLAGGILLAVRRLRRGAQH
ncbi:choice-of-anchor I family protein [Homoserinibacter sp. YIM 151385]|uniref:choice-of-anchor I family protein n=1 Tax=Homoserinibacter sp. YIM 151385 TaxID=2985506 RepID=UPI0022F086A3|nr:choice-of-anchor I family protein [Homoserinibacter sp. YIM 151385]WBU39116.1 choice-of-anchor I family protein [Homoserinibacter sp. YIM 151385]